MQVGHVPKIGILYWLMLSLVSVFGTNVGDAMGNVFGIGHLSSLALLVCCFLAIVAVERFDRGPPYLCFWLALVVTRVAAAHVSVVGRALVPHSPVPALALMALLCATLFCWRLAPAPAADLPAVHPLFWWTMLVAAALGSMIGDCVSEELALGNLAACAMAAALVLALLLLARGPWRVPFALYWVAVVALHAAGSAVARLAAHHFVSVALSTIVFGVSLGFVLTALRIRPRCDAPSDRT